MKKIIILALVMVFAGSSVFAATMGLTGQGSGGLEIRGAVATGVTAGGTSISRLSTKVQMTAQYNDTGYALATYHLSGTKAYGTGYDSTKLYWFDFGAPGSTLTVPSSSTTTEAFPSGTWTPM